MFNLEGIPKDPGCYLFKDDKKRVIYVGKAINIKKRVKTYFQKNDLDKKTQALISHVDTIDYIVTDNELEALLLENNLIKKYQPRYNIRLKDAKSHSYILLTDEVFPRIQITRRKIGKGDYFGPFISANERDYIFTFLKNTFNLRTCKKISKKPCLRYHINLCDAPCTGFITKGDYDKKIGKVKLILSGKTKLLLEQLQKEMKKYSNDLQYEDALKLRDQIDAIERLSEKQKIQREKKYNEDIINYIIKNDKVYLLLFNLYKGTLLNKNEFMFDFNDDFLEEFIVQYYSENQVPKEIILPQKISDPVISFLQSKKGQNVKVTIPKKGEKRRLIELAEKNIEITFFADEEKIRAIKSRLKLQEEPNVIECFDISHLSGTSTVGSMVQYRNGRPDKNNYRRFKIRTVNGIDDTKAISEVVKRRYTRIKNEDSELPNLIVIDGGRGQLNFAMDQLNKLDLKIPIISIAKHFEEIYLPGKIEPLKLSKKDNALKFIQQIRNEAHRFAIKYNRLLRKKEMLS